MKQHIFAGLICGYGIICAIDPINVLIGVVLLIGSIALSFAPKDEIVEGPFKDNL